MKITRNGVEIELTLSEMEQAFDEITNARYVEDLLRIAEDMEYELSYEEAVHSIPRLKKLVSDDSYINTIELFVAHLKATK